MSTDEQHAKQRRTAIEHAQTEQQTQDRYRLEDTIATAIDRCSRALSRGEPEHYGYVATTLDKTVLPALSRYTDKRLVEYDDELAAASGWDWAALSAFINHAEEVTRLVEQGTRDAGGTLTTTARGYADDGATGRQIVERALRSVTAIAEAEQIVMDDYARRVTANGHTVKLGEHLQKGDMDLGGPVSAVSLQAGSLKTLFCGGTGFGKSCGVEHEGEDFYQQSFRQGRDYKLIDLVDLDTGESWCSDIPQQQPALRRAREEMGLAPDFAASDELSEPSIEVLAPLTPGLASEELPYNCDDERFTVQPFVVPASELRKPVLIPAIMSRVSDDQEQTIRQAYDDVDADSDDWSLRDLADAIRDRDELSPKHKADAIGVLRSLQSKGFIRTRSHPDTLDWREVFKDTETITVFTQALFDENDDIGKMLCLAYLVDKILSIRKSTFGLPDCVLLMRELWEVVPHNRRDSSDERAAAIQEAMGYILAKVMRKLRHFDLHVIADTQEPGDLNIAIREMFNRYVVYSANQKTIDNIFSWTQNDKRGSFWGTMTAKKGQAGIVGQVQPAIDNRDIEYLSPVEYAPPSHHHFDKDRDASGWHLRAKYLTPVDECPECDSGDLERSEDRTTVTCQDCGEETEDLSLGRTEELRRPLDVDGVEWDDQIPAQLQIETQDRSKGPSVDMRPVAAFAERCLETGDDTDYIHKEDVRQMFNEFLRSHDRDAWDFSQRSKTTTFSNRLKDCFKDDAFESKKRQQPSGGRGYAFVGLTLTEQGTRIFEAIKNDVEDAAAPIRGD